MSLVSQVLLNLSEATAIHIQPRVNHLQVNKSDVLALAFHAY